MKLESMELVFCDARKNTITASKTINTNIALTSVSDQKGQLKVEFEHTVTYDPDGSHIRTGGRAVYSGSEGKAAAEEWAKNGRITGASGEFIMNSINYAASVNGVLIARAFNLMPPVALATLAFAPKK
jgi:hypothetical protein